MLHCYEIKKHGASNFLHHLRLCGKYWNDTWLPATSHCNHTHPKHRRHCPSHVPHDGHRSLRLYATGRAAPRRRHMVNVHHQCCHLRLQLRYLCNKDSQRLFQKEKIRQKQERSYTCSDKTADTSKGGRLSNAQRGQWGNQWE